ncbi:hypothetical protein EJ03DRAFT_354926 [Teratosphaeria nubilosa]|uniref:Uncharacterized protein n=1 Tax=Teratosphaeria nubilosa TaxID=161662 RepID=A0A6G1KXI8_9PEZI|nr:hypothetical protein EJ03DRAFT_354926 [Teratosphaeria nubilosa]
MSSTTPSLSCLSGGNLYACASGSQFIGCCDTNPCSSGCPSNQLHPTSFDAGQYGLFAPQQCGSTLAEFYTCINQQVSNDTSISAIRDRVRQRGKAQHQSVVERQAENTFWGCCYNDPCTAGECVPGNLVDTSLSSNTTEAQPYLSLNQTLPDSYSEYAYSSNSSYSSTSTSTDTLVALSTITTSISSSTSQTTTATALTSSPVRAQASASGVPVSNAHSKDLGAAIGGPVGGLAVLGALALGLLYLLRRRPKSPPPITALDAAVVNHTTEMPPYVVEPDFQGPSQPQHHHTPSYSPAISQRSFSPIPTSYLGEHDRLHIPHELPVPLEAELDSGQRYHPYRPS